MKHLVKTSRQAKFEVSAHSVLRNLARYFRAYSEELPYKNKSAGKPNVHGGGIWLVSPMNA